MILLQASIGLGILVVLAYIVTFALGVTFGVDAMMKRKAKAFKVTGKEMRLITKMGYFIFSVIVSSILVSVAFYVFLRLLYSFAGPLYT